MQWIFCKKSIEGSVAELEPFFVPCYRDRLIACRHQIILSIGRKNYPCLMVNMEAPALEFDIRVHMYPHTNVIVGQLIAQSKTRLKVGLVGIILTDCYKIKKLLLFQKEVWQEKWIAIIHELEDRYLLT